VTFGATSADVSARLTRDSFSSTTSPSTTEITAFIAEGAALVRQTLRAAGVAADPANDSDGQRVCRAHVIDYATARVLDALALGSDEQQGSDRAAAMLAAFNAAMAEFRAMGSTMLASYLSPTGTSSPTASRVRSFSGELPARRYSVGNLDGSF
jgi:hypothetical protein